MENSSKFNRAIERKQIVMAAQLSGEANISLSSDKLYDENKINNGNDNTGNSNSNSIEWENGNGINAWVRPVGAWQIINQAPDSPPHKLPGE